jgi:hypothetical protein
MAEEGTNEVSKQRGEFKRLQRQALADPLFHGHNEVTPVRLAGGWAVALSLNK